MDVRECPVTEASVGDYHYVLVTQRDGTFECTRVLIDRSMAPERLEDWSQLPEVIRVQFVRAQQTLAR